VIPPAALARLPLAALLVLVPCACTGTRLLAHPTVQIQTAGGHELGVCTDYGVVFLGRTAHAGDAEVTAWFGDGPSVESTVIEPVGADLYTTETEIRLPSVPLRFVDPEPGETLYVIGVRGNRFWTREVEVAADPSVDGILLNVPGDLKDAEDQIGAGVYWMPEEDDLLHMQLVGLVSGRVRIEGKGGTREYLTVVGPRSLWRLVAHRRDRLERKRWIYREDIL
jgi:hypothetical protein